jgi:hypothetical protein
MSRYRVSGQFTVGPIDLPKPEREARVAMVEGILNKGLGNCTTIESFIVARQMRPENPNKLEPDLAEEVTIVGEDREAVFTAYRNDPGHANMVNELSPLDWLTWNVIVYQIS